MRFVLTSLLVLAGCAEMWAQAFPSLNWTYPLPAPAFGSAAAADVDGDGLLEIIFTTYTNDGKAHCINAEDGSPLWIYDIGGCGDVAPVIYDLDGDDTLDVFINGSCNPTCFSINAMTGQLNWSKASGGGDSPPTVADVDGDSRPEILFGNFNGEVVILDGENGNVNRVVLADSTGDPIQTEPTVGDLDRDGDLDFIVANHFNTSGFHIWAFDYMANDTLWTFHKVDTTGATYHAYHGGVLADVDNDSKLEYVIGANDGSIRALNAEDGSQLWEVNGFTNVISALSCANFDADSALEVVFVNNDYINFNDRIGLLDGRTGSIDWALHITFSAFRGVAIGDINGNGMLDCVSGHYMGEVMAVEPFTGLIWNTDVDTFFNPNLPYLEVDHGPLIADFDQNGTMDVFTVAGYGTYTPDSLNVGMAFSFSAGTGSCPEWLMFRHDVRRTAYLSASEVDSLCLAAAISPPELPRVLLYPMPFSETLQVDARALPIVGNVHFEVLDLAGRSLIETEFRAGEVHAWEPGLPAGMYIWRATQAGGVLQAGKMQVQD